MALPYPWRARRALWRALERRPSRYGRRTPPRSLAHAAIVHAWSPARIKVGQVEAAREARAYQANDDVTDSTEG